MGCLLWSRRKSTPEPSRLPTPRLVEIAPERRQTIRATTEFKWPARIADVADVARPSVRHLSPPPAKASQPMPEKEVFVTTPRSFHSPRSPSPFLVQRCHHQRQPEPQDYHISPLPTECQQCEQEKDQEHHKRLPQQQDKKPTYPTGSREEPAELPPNDLSHLRPLPQELPAAMPPIVFAQELEAPPFQPKTRTIPRSRFSYQT
ncbi:hypothetical protein BD289DRAFT_419996 [Coniella lustricola]|uniref:Uncharacterized protein n=1 Tax=Coniella lustricola TaxID=2025994 RepID=A0A2T3ANY5_9PEZI|nr:hypothetical protein BD289DRAFT_419996 [Coniella lustricola]